MTTKKLQLLRGGVLSTSPPKIRKRTVCNTLDPEGLRYRLNVKGLPGTPDIANVRQKFVIFVHGCFWHRHPGCPFATFPKTNQRFWSEKFEANVLRDRRKKIALERTGFRVVIVWACEAQRPNLRKRLARALRGLR